MSVTFIPRVFGGTIVLSIGGTSLPTLLIVATFRDGSQPVSYRDGELTAAYRDGQVIAGGR